MEYRIQIFLYFLLASLPTFAQKAGNCDCKVNLSEIIKDVESNYPGFKVKTNDGKSSSYLALKKDALRTAEAIIERETCFYTITKYLTFFKDNHIIFSDRKIIPKQPLLTGKVNQLDPLTGLWHRRSDSVTIRITKVDHQTHRAYLSKTATAGKGGKNKVYFDLIGDENEFKIKKYGGWLTTDLLRGRRLNNLIIEPNGIWERLGAVPKNNRRPITFGVSNKTHNYQLIDTSTYYLGIPAFNVNEKKFDSLLVNDAIPTIVNNKIKHLIIDLRNNVGGNSSFLFLLRLMYDKPFGVPGDFVYSTPSIISKYEESAAAGSKYHQLFLPKLKAHIGGFVQRDSLRIKLEVVYQYPQRISILVNENCASSTEYFLKLAKNCRRVTIFGRHTAGTLDYSELLQPEKLPCADYSYLRPTTKSFWTDTAPIDQKGIYPDVDLSDHPDDEWVDMLIRNVKGT